jgi:hypothetical protein
MMLKKHEQLLSLILRNTRENAEKHPNGAFFFPLKPLMWLPMRHEATLTSTKAIKFGLLEHVRSHTYALDRSQGNPYRDRYNISTPTVNKYLHCLDNKIQEDYSKKTWNHLFELSTAAPFKRNISVSQFCWEFLKTHYPEGINMLFDNADPSQSTVEAFWINSKQAIMVNLSTASFLFSYLLMLKTLLPQLSKKDNRSFDSGVFLKDLLNVTEKYKFESNADLQVAVSQLKRKDSPY